MTESKRGDFYLIKFLDNQLRCQVLQTEGIDLSEIVLRQSYAAILEQCVYSKDGEPLFWDFNVLGERAPIIQLRIMDKDIKNEEVWIKYIASSKHDQILITTEGILQDVNRLSEDIDKLKRTIENDKMALSFSFENSELDWQRVRWLEELLALKETKLNELNNKEDKSK